MNNKKLNLSMAMLMVIYRTMIESANISLPKGYEIFTYTKETRRDIAEALLEYMNSSYISVND